MENEWEDDPRPSKKKRLIFCVQRELVSVWKYALLSKANLLLVFSLQLIICRGPNTTCFCGWKGVRFIFVQLFLVYPLGGLAAVIYTDTLQFFIMIIGAFVLMIMSKMKLITPPLSHIFFSLSLALSFDSVFIAKLKMHIT